MKQFIHNRIVKPTIRSQVGQLVIQTGILWQREQCLDLGASLAYFALFSLFPIILVILSLLGFVLGPESSAYDQIFDLIQGSLPSEVVEIVASTLRQLNENSVGAGITGFVLVLFTGSGFFSALDRVIERIWSQSEGEDETQTFVATAREVVNRKLLSFALTIGSALLVLISQVSSFILQLVLRIIENVDRVITFVDFDELLAYRGIEMLSTLVLLTLVIMTLFRLLPPKPVAWGDVVPGSLTTATLFLVLEQGFSSSVIHLGSTYLSYGVIGGVMILLLWLFLLCQIFLLGNVITFVYAHRFGSHSQRRPPPPP